MRRRDFVRTTAAASLALAAPALAQPAASRILKVIPQANLTSLDPIWTTAVVTRNHAYLVYDQLVAVNANFEPQPQMAEAWMELADGLEWRFRLRPGLRFHDNEPVLARDAVASIRRWWARDSLGQTVADLTDELSSPDDRTIRFRLKRRFALLPVALGKASPMPMFVMPERIALTDPYKAITDPTGSGPFRFVRAEWNPGSRAVWEKFPHYAPRDEPVDGIAGGRRANVDRVEWTVIPDSATAAAAMTSGEQDYWEYPLHDLIPILQGNPGITVGQRLAQGTYCGIRLNHLQPPFNNPAVRRALLMAVDQRDYLRAVVGDGEPGKPQPWAACESVYTCGAAFETAAGNDLLRLHSVEKAAAALKASGYKGERAVLLAPSDLSADQRAVARHGGPHAPGRLQRGPGGNGLGYCDPAPGQQGAGGERRLERVPLDLVRSRHPKPRHLPANPNEQGRRLVRLAGGRGDGGDARPLAANPRLCGTKADRRCHSGPSL